MMRLWWPGWSRSIRSASSLAPPVEHQGTSEWPLGIYTQKLVKKRLLNLRLHCRDLFLMDLIVSLTWSMLESLLLEGAQGISSGA